ncbi:DDE_3 domain-containing protein [Trichonephila clavipes]|nr:DDE_3 domain-containing protein [Trichonephila clavipes]
MPGKRARRHFSQLSEFERGLIIGIKTAGWSSQRVAGQVIIRSVTFEIVESSGHEKVPTRGKPGMERPRRPQGETMEGSCGKDEAHFWLNGYVNKQNCRIWSEANLQAYVETPLHPETLTVWCALWAGGIIGWYFFKNDEGHNVTVNGDRYRAMISTFFIPELNNHDVQELWF